MFDFCAFQTKAKSHLLTISINLKQNRFVLKISVNRVLPYCLFSLWFCPNSQSSCYPTAKYQWNFSTLCLFQSLSLFWNVLQQSLLACKICLASYHLLRWIKRNKLNNRWKSPSRQRWVIVKEASKRSQPSSTHCHPSRVCTTNRR